MSFSRSVAQRRLERLPGGAQRKRLQRRSPRRCARAPPRARRAGARTGSSESSRAASRPWTVSGSSDAVGAALLGDALHHLLGEQRVATGSARPARSSSVARAPRLRAAPRSARASRRGPSGSRNDARAPCVAARSKRGAARAARRARGRPAAPVLAATATGSRSGRACPRRPSGCPPTRARARLRWRAPRTSRELRRRSSRARSAGPLLGGERRPATEPAAPSSRASGAILRSTASCLLGARQQRPRAARRACPRTVPGSSPSQIPHSARSISISGQYATLRGRTARQRPPQHPLPASALARASARARAAGATCPPRPGRRSSTRCGASLRADTRSNSPSRRGELLVAPDQRRPRLRRRCRRAPLGCRAARAPATPRPARLALQRQRLELAGTRLPRRSARWVRSPTRMPPTGAAACSRAATLTASPSHRVGVAHAAGEHLAGVDADRAVRARTRTRAADRRRSARPSRPASRTPPAPRARDRPRARPARRTRPSRCRR